MPDIQTGEWSYRKCPAPEIAIAEPDKGTLWLVQFVARDGRWKGEVAITQGEHAKAHAQLFAASPDLLAAAKDVVAWHDTLDGDMDNQYGNDAIERLKAAVAKANATPAAPTQKDDADRTFDSIYDLP